MEYDPIKMDGRDTVFHRNLEKKEGKKKKKKVVGENLQEKRFHLYLK